MDSAQHPNLHHQLILPVISPVCTPTPRLGQGWQELIDTKYRPMRVQVVGISVSYLSLPHHPCKVSVSTCISGKGKPKLVAFNSSKEQVQSSHLLYIFQSFWDPGGLPALPGFLPQKCQGPFRRKKTPQAPEQLYLQLGPYIQEFGHTQSQRPCFQSPQGEHGLSL